MFKGHPKGLIIASIANMGERFGFYTMMAILLLFLQAKFGLDQVEAGSIYSTNSTLNRGGDVFKKIYSMDKLRQKNISTNNITLNISIDNFSLDLIQSFQAENRFLLDCFVSQRKVYRYYKAYSELENEEISQEEFERVENSCVLTLKKEDKNELLSKIEYLYRSLKNTYPEELEFMNDDDLADILKVSKINLKHTLEDLKIASK